MNNLWNLLCDVPRLCVAALALDSFCGIREALYGVFDGDKNVEVPYLLQCTMGDVLAEELHRGPRQEDYMTNTFLTMQRLERTVRMSAHHNGTLIVCVAPLQEAGHRRPEDGRLSSFVPHQTRPSGSR